MKTITICVTQDDIDKGEPCVGDQCAIARAVSRIADGLFVHVTRHDACFGGSADFPEFKAVLPFEVSEWVRHFDMPEIAKLEGGLVKPIVFDVSIPDDLYAKYFAVNVGTVEEVPA